MELPGIEVWVLTHASKLSVTLTTLESLGIQHRVYQNHDWGWPDDHPELQTSRSRRPSMRDYALRQYRAFRGHQDIMARADKLRHTLVFEDDMTLMPDTSPAEVHQQLIGATQFITGMRYDAVSFHARNQSPPKNSITRYGREYVELSLTTQDGNGHRYFLQPVANAYDGKYATWAFRWHEGCLAYMVGQAGREKWLNAGHGFGMPCDLFLANELHTIVMRNTIFEHNMSQGSLMTNTVLSPVDEE